MTDDGDLFDVYMCWSLFREAVNKSQDKRKISQDELLGKMIVVCWLLSCVGHCSGRLCTSLRTKKKSQDKLQ